MPHPRLVTDPNAMTLPRVRLNAPTPSEAADEESAIVSGVLIDPDGGAVGTALGGRYRLLGVIGAGGMGTIYGAHDRVLDQPVAIKRLRAGRSREEVLRACLVREAKLAQRVSHPNVVRVHGVDTVGTEMFVVMEYVAGSSLAEILRQRGPLDPATTVGIGRVLADALGTAHRAGVIHCDLKPENVLVNDRGRVVIVDFGVAQILGERCTRGGTPAYMAPEQLAGDLVDARTDVFNLGGLLYDLLTSGDAGAGTDPAALPPVPPHLAALLAAATERDPDRRPSSMALVARTLAKIHRTLVPTPHAQRQSRTPNPFSLAA